MEYQKSALGHEFWLCAFSPRTRDMKRSTNKETDI